MTSCFLDILFLHGKYFLDECSLSDFNGKSTTAEKKGARFKYKFNLHLPEPKYTRKIPYFHKYFSIPKVSGIFRKTQKNPGYFGELGRSGKQLRGREAAPHMSAVPLLAAVSSIHLN